MGRDVVVKSLDEMRAYVLEPGVFARVGPRERRKLLPGPDGADVLCLGAIPGELLRASGPAAH